MRPLHPLTGLACRLLMLRVDEVRFLLLCLRQSPTLAAETLFLHKQLALYQERHGTPRPAINNTRMALIWPTRWFDWRRTVAIVQPVTLIRWHPQGFCLVWRWTSRPARPPLPADLQALVRRMAREHSS